MNDGCVNNTLYTLILNIYEVTRIHTHKILKGCVRLLGSTEVNFNEYNNRLL